MCWAVLLFACVLLLPKWIADPFHAMTRDPTSLTLPALLAVGWLALALRRLSQGDLTLRKSGLEIYQLALFCLALLGLIVRQRDYFHVFPAVAAIVLFFGPMLSFHLVINLDLDREELMRLCRLVAVFGAGTSLLSLRVPFQYLPGFEFVRELAFGPLEAPMVRAYSPLGGPYLTGPVAAALLPLCAALSMTSRGLRRLLYGGCGVVCLAAAVLSVQRLVIGSLAFAAVLFVWFARELVWRNRWWAIASAFSTAALMFVLIIALGPYVRFARLVRREVTYRGDQIRIASVRAGVEAALLHPILGTGIGRYFPREGAAEIVAVDQRRALHSPHSLPLLAFGEMGLFAMLLVLVLMLKPPIELFRLCSTARDERARWILSALACGALVLGVCSIFSWSLARMPRYSLFFWMFLGLAYRAAHIASPALRGEFEGIAPVRSAGGGQARSTTSADAREGLPGPWEV
jgi:hypothetical protein